MSSYETSALFFVFAFKRVFPSKNCRILLQKMLSYINLRHSRFELSNHDVLKKHLNITEGIRKVDVMKLDAKRGLQKCTIITVNGLMNMDQDEISMKVETASENRPCVGVTGPEGEYNAVIGYNNSSSFLNSRYGDQGVCMYTNRTLYNKGEYDGSLSRYNAIKEGDVIKMVVKNHTLTYYQNNVRMGPFKENPIRLLKGREYKFAVGLVGRASVRIVH